MFFLTNYNLPWSSNLSSTCDGAPILLPSSSRSGFRPSRALFSRFPTIYRVTERSRPPLRPALTYALEVACEVVKLDSTNDDPYGTGVTYGKSVSLLSKAMRRVINGEDSWIRPSKRWSTEKRGSLEGGCPPTQGYCAYDNSEWDVRSHALVHIRHPAQRWTAFEDIGSGPCGRHGHAMSSAGRRVVVLGGA